MKINKLKRNLLKFVAFLLIVGNTSSAALARTFNEPVIARAAEPVYGAFNMPDSAKWVYVHPTLGLDTNTGKTPQDPFKTLSKAQTEMPYLGAILLLADMTVVNRLTVTRNIIIASSPVLSDGSVNDEIFTIRRDPLAVDNIFNVSWNIKLHLANIIIDGNRLLTEEDHVSGSVIWVGTGHATYQGALYLHPGSVIRGGNRTLGGGAVILQRGLLYMNGGSIEYNYAIEEYPVVGGLQGSINNKIYLISGEISNNIGKAITVGPVFSNTSELYIGGKFKFQDNITNPRANYLPYSEFGTYLINNFDERKTLDVDGVLDEILDAVVIVNENFVTVNPKPESLPFIAPRNDPTLYPQYDANIHRYVWKSLKEYNVLHEVITKPTVNTTGLLGRKAYVHDDIDGNPVYDDNDYIDEVVLPKLDTLNYQNITFDAANNEAVYEYIHNLNTYVIRYTAPAHNYEWQVALAPTETEVGAITLIHPDFPGVIFNNVVLPMLSTTNYATVASPTHIIFTYVDPLGVSHDFQVQRPFFNYIADVKVVPTVTTMGSADLLHPDYPGLIFGSIVLPVLNDFDYDLIIADNIVTYRYFHNLSGTTVNVKINIPTNGYTVRQIMVTPTAESIGMAILIHAAVPGYERNVVLPLLSALDYTIEIDPSVDFRIGNVIYTYHDAATNMAIAISHPYDYEALTWDYGVSPTVTATGTITGTSAALPGAIFTVEIPELSSDFYDIEEDEEFITYTLKDKTYGTFVYTLAIEVLEEPTKLWPYIIGAVAVLLLISGAVMITLKLRNDKKEKSEPESDSQQQDNIDK